MVVLTRSEAVVLASFLQLFSLTEEERLIETQDALDDGGVVESSKSGSSIVLRKHLEQTFSSYTNRYVQSFLMENLNVSVRWSGYKIVRLPLL